jgi:hypothetical protein
LIEQGAFGGRGRRRSGLPLRDRGQVATRHPAERPPTHHKPATAWSRVCLLRLGNSRPKLRRGHPCQRGSSVNSGIIRLEGAWS